MTRESNQKLKLLYLKDILEQETDDEHGITTAQIIERLAERDIPAERKTIYRDLDALRAYGMDIIKRQGTDGAHTEYILGARDFEFPELLLMVDAVQSSRFLTERKSNALVEHIKKLASRHQAKTLGKRIYVENRIKMQNESIYYNVDHIQNAIKCGNQVEFQYFSYDLDKNKVMRHKGATYRVTPVALIYSREYYYLEAFDETVDDFRTYRVDRMQRIGISKRKSVHNRRIATYDATAFEAQSFDMFSGEAVSVELLVAKDSMNWVIDRFGTDVKAQRVDDDSAKVFVKVLKSDVFFGWLCQFGTSVKLLGPSSLVDEYTDYLDMLRSTYND